MTSRTSRAVAASPGARRPGRTGSRSGPLLCGLAAAAAAAAVAAARWATWARHDIAAFILVGRHFADPARVPAGIPLQPTYGYDGQYFYRLALDPANLSRVAFGIRVDHSYRFMRIGYPALTWLLSAGQHALVPGVLVGVNVLAVGAMGVLGGALARDGGRGAWWGLLLPGYFGLVTSVTRDTAEPLAAALLLAGLLALRRRRPGLAAAALACGALTRETVMVAVAAIAVTRLVSMARARRADDGRTGFGRDDLAWGVPAVVFAAWQGGLYAVTGSLALVTDGGRNAGLPFSAPVRALADNLGSVSLAGFTATDLWLVEFAALVFCAAAAAAAVPAARGGPALGWEKVALVAYVIEICLVNPNTWGSTNAGMRSFVEVYLMAVVLLLSRPARPAGPEGTRRAWVLPALSALMIAAVACEVRRRLTIA